jgi:biotin synthase
MCYAIPGKVLASDGKKVVLEYFGEKKIARNISYDLNSGEYVYAQGGIVVGKISEAEALPILELWENQFFLLKQIDAGLASRAKNAHAPSDDPAGQDGLFPILKKAESSGSISRNEMLHLISLDMNPSQSRMLHDSANRIRQEKIGNSCCVHGILEFSNHCSCNCNYCGIRGGNKAIKRYRMSRDEIIASVDYAVESLGFKAIVLQSGEDESYSDDELVSIVSEIRKKHGILLFMSIGKRSRECYSRLFDAGAYGALVRFETSNSELYEKIRPGKKLEDRLSLIRWLKKKGFILATGFMIGIPGSTNDDLINDILLTKKISPEMYSFGPFIPHPQTPLGQSDMPSLGFCLKAISIARLADPQSHILVTTALETLSPESKEQGLLAGANSLMIDTTTPEFQKYYYLYPGKTKTSKTEEQIKETIRLLKDLGRAPTDLGI